MEVLGTVHFIGQEQQVSASFKKRELVVETDEQYKQKILIEFTQDKTDLLNNYKVGDQVKVSINIGGREWVNPQGETKYFNSVKGWRIEKGEAVQSPPPIPVAAPTFESATNFNEEEHDDLPF